MSFQDFLKSRKLQSLKIRYIKDNIIIFYCECTCCTDDFSHSSFINIKKNNEKFDVNFSEIGKYCLSRHTLVNDVINLIEIYETSVAINMPTFKNSITNQLTI